LGWGLITPYRDGWFLAENHNAVPSYVAAILCAWAGAVAVAASLGTAFVGVFCVLAPSSVVQNLLILVMCLVAGSVLSLGAFIHLVRYIGHEVLTPWVVRALLGIDATAAMRAMYIRCILCLPVGVCIGSGILGVALLFALLTL